MSAPTFLLALCLAAPSVPSPHTPITPGRLDSAEPAPAGALRLTRRADRLRLSGAVVLVLGGFAWGWMLGGLLGGARERRSHDRLVAATNAGDRPLDADTRARAAFHDDEGARANAHAIAGAVTGVALTAIGAALMARSLVLRRRAAGLAPLGLGATWRMNF